MVRERGPRYGCLQRRMFRWGKDRITIRHSSLATHARNLRDSNIEKGPLLGLIYREKGLGLIGGKSLWGFSAQFVGANIGLLYRHSSRSIPMDEMKVIF